MVQNHQIPAAGESLAHALVSIGGQRYLEVIVA